MAVATPHGRSSSYTSPCTFTRSFTPAATPAVSLYLPAASPAASPATPAATPAATLHLPPSTCPPLTRWAEEFEQAYTFVTDPTGAAQEAATSGGGGVEPPAVVWRAYPEEWIVATKPKIGPPKQVGRGRGRGRYAPWDVGRAAVVGAMSSLGCPICLLCADLHACQISSLAERPSQDAITAVLKEASEEGGGLLGAIGLGNVF